MHCILEIKLLFPNTIDKFQDDFSLKVIDQKPIYLKHINLKLRKSKNPILNNIELKKIDTSIITVSKKECQKSV